MTKRETDSVSEHVGKMAELRSTLEELGEKQSDALFQVTLIASMPSQYSNLLEVWEMSHPDMRTTANLISRLLKREEDLKQVCGETSFIAGKSFQELTIEEKKKVTKCKYCQKKGHWGYECPDAEEYSKRQMNKEHPTKKREDVAGFMFTMAHIRPSIKDIWLADTGATAHMCHNSSWFDELAMYPAPQECSVGDGYRVKVLGKGLSRQW